MADVTADAKAGFCRIEVLTGPGRRRRWSALEKAQVVAETLAAGASVSEVARRWQLCPQQVFTWRRDARAGFLTLPAGTSDLVQASFVPVMQDVADAALAGSDVPDAASRMDGARKAAAANIEIEVAGAVVRVAGGTDTALLADVLRAIRASAA